MFAFAADYFDFTLHSCINLASVCENAKLEELLTINVATILCFQTVRLDREIIKTDYVDFAFAAHRGQEHPFNERSFFNLEILRNKLLTFYLNRVLLLPFAAISQSHNSATCGHHRKTNTRLCLLNCARLPRKLIVKHFGSTNCAIFFAQRLLDLKFRSL